MVEFELVAALAAGFVATVVMTAMMQMSAMTGMTNMPPMPLVTGSMLTGDRSAANKLGAAIHFVMMGTIMFGLAYAALFTAFDDQAWWVGALIGIAHGLLVGLVFMPMMPSVHPRMSRELVSAGSSSERGTAGSSGDGEVQLTAPGFFGKDWGGMTPIGLLMGHAVYGIVIAVVYGWLA